MFIHLLLSVVCSRGIDFPPDSTARIPKQLFEDAASFSTPVIVPDDELATSLLVKLKPILINKKRVFVGYGVNRTTFFTDPTAEPITVKWIPDDSDIQECLANGLSGHVCQNHITLVEEIRNNQLLICGTNAGSPMCRFYTVEDGENGLTIDRSSNQDEIPGSDIISTNPDWSLNSLYEPKSKHMYVAKEMGSHRGELQRFSYGSKRADFLKNPEKAFSAYGPVKFIKILEHGDHIFLFFRERLRNGTDVSRVGTICKNDLGGSQNILSNKFTTFVKTTLDCPVSAEFSFR